MTDGRGLTAVSDVGYQIGVLGGTGLDGVVGAGGGPLINLNLGWSF